MVPYLQRTLAVALGLASISCTTAAGLSSHLSRRAQCSATLDEAQVRPRIYHLRRLLILTRAMNIGATLLYLILRTRR